MRLLLVDSIEPQRDLMQTLEAERWGRLEEVIQESQSMLEDLADASRQCHGASLLAQLLGGSTGTTTRQAETAAVGAIVMALTTHPMQWEVQEAGVAALASIADDPHRQQWLLLTNAYEAVLGALSRSARAQPQIAATACEALAHLASTTDAVRRAVHAGVSLCWGRSSSRQIPQREYDGFLSLPEKVT